MKKIIMRVCLVVLLVVLVSGCGESSKMHSLLQKDARTLERKYELTDATLNIGGTDKETLVLYRIRALKDFGSVHTGDLGGFVECSENLSQADSCWIFDDSKIFGSAYVAENAIVSGSSKVFNKAFVHGNAIIRGKSSVDGAEISGNRVITDRIVYSKRYLASLEKQRKNREKEIRAAEARWRRREFNHGVSGFVEGVGDAVGTAAYVTVSICLLPFRSVLGI